MLVNLRKKMKIKKKNFNWYGFSHTKVKKKFEGDLSYCGTFSVKGFSNPVAVYHSKNPNREKSHKDYLLLWNTSSGGFVSGMDAEEMKKERYQEGIYCTKCKELLYSVTTHDYRECSCGLCFVDGGKDYLRTNTQNIVLIDLITGKKAELNSLKFIKGDY